MEMFTLERNFPKKSLFQRGRRRRGEPRREGAAVEVRERERERERACERETMADSEEEENTLTMTLNNEDHTLGAVIVDVLNKR